MAARTMTINGQITESDFVRAAFVHIRPSRMFAAIGIALVLLALLVTIWAVGDALGTGRRPLLALSLVLALGYLAVYFALLYPYRARKTYRQYKAVGVRFSATIDNEGIRIESELGAAIVPWSHIHKWREGTSLFLLYPTDTLYHIVPKAAFSGELAGEFRAVLSQRLGPAT